MTRLGRLIGRGRIAEVFEWGSNQALKLFYEGRPKKEIEHEAFLGREINLAGISSPAIGERIDIDGRSGFVLEKIVGHSMLSEFTSKPWNIMKNAKILAECHANIHSHQIDSLPSQRKKLIHDIESVTVLDKNKKKKIVSLLNTLEDGNTVCHGDYHPDNIIIAKGGAIVIDWPTVTKGNPLGDVARTSLMLRMGEMPPGTPLIIGWIISIVRVYFHNIYLKNYFGLRPEGKKDFDKWLLPIAAARLQDGIKEEQDELLSQIDKMLKN